MKKIRSFIAVVLCFLIALSITGGISADTVYNSAIIKDHLQGMIGNSYQRGLCLGFVSVQQEYCYGVRSSSCCAHNYASIYTDSTDINNIPIGADVFFYGGSTVCGGSGGCGAICGHVGIYVGDGYIIHSIAMSTTGNATIRKDSLSQLADWGYRFTGWGWHANVALEYKPDEYVRYDISNPDSYPLMMRTLDYTSGTAQYGRDVLFVQQGLADMGYSLTADAYYGPGCEAVVRQFQTDNGIAATGVMNEDTWNVFTAKLTDKYEIKEEFTVTYDLNVGTGESFNDTLTEGDGYMITSEIPVREGYVFRGWSLSSDGGGMRYVLGDAFYVSGNTTFYAVWVDEMTVAADINKDGVVNSDDLSILLSQYSNTY